MRAAVAIPTCKRHSSGAKVHGANRIIRDVGQHDAEDHIELECRHQTAAPFRRSQLGNVDRAQY